MTSRYDITSAFLRSYLIAAFWTEDDNAPSGDYESTGRPEDNLKRLTKNAYARAEKDCREFQEKAAELLGLAHERDYDEEQAGHDFWLTRNGHGTGFWGRDALDVSRDEWRALGSPKVGEPGWDEWDKLRKDTLGKKLSAVAKEFGECYLTKYRGWIYLE